MKRSLTDDDWVRLLDVMHDRYESKYHQNDYALNEYVFLLTDQSLAKKAGLVDWGKDNNNEGEVVPKFGSLLTPAMLELVSRGFAKKYPGLPLGYVLTTRGYEQAKNKTNNSEKMKKGFWSIVIAVVTTFVGLIAFIANFGTAVAFLEMLLNWLK